MAMFINFAICPVNAHTLVVGTVVGNTDHNWCRAHQSIEWEPTASIGSNPWIVCD